MLQVFYLDVAYVAMTVNVSSANAFYVASVSSASAARACRRRWSLRAQRPRMHKAGRGAPSCMHARLLSLLILARCVRLVAASCPNSSMQAAGVRGQGTGLSLLLLVAASAMNFPPKWSNRDQRQRHREGHARGVRTDHWCRTSER
jgi:hypothetical protein